MSEQKNISTRKVFRFVIGAVLVIIFMVALAAASNRQSNKTIKGLEVKLNDEQAYSFLQQKDIETLLLKNRHIDLGKASIASLDLKLMEDIALTNPWVAKADIYVDNRQVLSVNILQREPIARIFDLNGASYYMDSTLHTMPVSAGYAYAAPVFTNVPVLRQDSMNRVLQSKIARVSKVLQQDSFWQAQITQVAVQPDQTFVLIPLMGNQSILLGDTSRIEDKLKNLMAFYKQVSGKIGWDKYETLDLRFKGQVVASPSIGWVPPRVSDTAAIRVDVPATAPGASILSKDAKPATTRVVQPATVPAKGKPVAVQSGTAKVTPPPVAKKESAKVATPVKKEQKKETRSNNKSQSPKYIYTGKHSGNR